ncbi:MAG: SGNH/GDSL hydrolase family protein [Planctomycetota bacterium]|nr:SGNH/GDSL hydrolase family protein [Planctomycetota bacterium]
MRICLPGLFAFAALLLAPPAALLAADTASRSTGAAKTGAAQETDSRLHADGQGWRLDQAKITDKSRPRVLLIGDSILSGYLPLVTKALDGKAYVDAWVNPYCQSSHRLREMLAEVLERGPYDVVHFNMGLHGWQKGRIPEGQFEPLTKAYVEAMQSLAPKAKLIWASSTPVTVKGKPGELDPEINPIIVEHNRMAAKVMNERHVPVSDLYSLLAGKLDLARGDQFHWTAPVYKILADAVVNSVLQALPAKPQPSANVEPPNPK